MLKEVKKYYTEYATAYDLKTAMNFTMPKIYTANGDLSKRWYVYYSFRHPETGKMVRQPPVTMEINRRFKTEPERLKHLKIVQQVIHDLLKDGFSPYQEFSLPEVAPKPAEPVQQSIDPADHHPSAQLILQILEIKIASIASTSVGDYRYRVNQFIDFLKSKKIEHLDIRKITKRTVHEFLDEVLLQSSARNRNNTKAVLSSIFKELAAKDYIDRNFILEIDPLKKESKRDRTIKTDDLQRILHYLEKNDPLLLLYIEFISYFFLRPIEVNRLTLLDINLTDNRLTVRTKQKAHKTKIIPELIQGKLKRYIGNKTQPDLLLFTPSGVGEWTAVETSRRDSFSKRFNTVKSTLALPEDYTLYSFRHTFITKIYMKLRKTYSKAETISILAEITGHDSDALWGYIHHIDAELPEDYSHLLK